MERAEGEAATAGERGVRTTEAEKDHIKLMGVRWGSVLAATTFSVRQNAKFIGLDKIREPLAYKAALKATGYDIPAFTIPFNAGKAAFCQDIADEAFGAAVIAGQKVFSETVPA